MDSMLLEFEEINSTIDKYLNDLESDGDEELAPRQRNQTIDHQKSIPITKAKKVHNGGIHHPNLNPKRVTFSNEPNGIYDTGATSGVVSIEDAKYFISYGKNSKKILSFPTATLCLRQKE